MDKRKSILIVSVSIVSKLILLAAALFVRRLLIQRLGNDINGLNSLFSSIIGMLGVAELGIGRAITFSMYSPIIKDNKQQVAALYCLYKKWYLIIGIVILVIGIIIIPLLPYLINDYEQLSVNVYISFFLSLIAVVLSYGFSAKTSLIEAYKDNYITTGLMTVSYLVRYALQIAAILIWRSFTVFLICQIIGTLVLWALTEIAVRQKHGDIIVLHEDVDTETKTVVTRNVKAMVMHKVGTIMVNSVDSIIISGFIGVVLLGKYSNYNYIAAVLVSVLALFFTPLTSVVGHLCAEGNQEKSKGYFDYFYSLNFIIGVVFFLGYYAVIDSVVSLLFGTGLSVSHAIAFIITLNQFVQYMRNASLLFRNASGTFHNDRWKPIAEGVANIILSLLFVVVFPEEYRVVGVIVATIITNLLICDTVEPFVVFKHVFGRSPKDFYIKNYGYIGLFTLALFSLTYLTRTTSSPITGLIANGFISMGVSILILGLVTAVDKSFRNSIVTMGKASVRWMKRLTKV